MKERGKACEDISYYSSSSDLPCKKHPSSNSVGICAFCLKDRLIRLVCSDCGEQRLSSCSCSQISLNRDSSTFDIGSVARVSFLIENEKIGDYSGSRLPKLVKSEEMVMLKRSNSSCVEIKRGRLWSIGRLFKKKREKGSERISVGGGDEKSDWWLFDQMRVSRSRSLCSFRGHGGVFGSEDGSETMFSGGRSSVSGAKTSSVNGGMVYDSVRRSGFSETEVANKRIVSLKETDFNGRDESEFIHFKLDFASELNPEFSATRGREAMAMGDDTGLKRGRGSSKSWRWIFGPPPNWVISRKKEDLAIKT